MEYRILCLNAEFKYNGGQLGFSITCGIFSHCKQVCICVSGYITSPVISGEAIFVRDLEQLHSIVWF